MSAEAQPRTSGPKMAVHSRTGVSFFARLLRHSERWGADWEDIECRSCLNRCSYRCRVFFLFFILNFFFVFEYAASQSTRDDSGQKLNTFQTAGNTTEILPPLFILIEFAIHHVTNMGYANRAFISLQSIHKC